MDIFDLIGPIMVGPSSPTRREPCASAWPAAASSAKRSPRRTSRSRAFAATGRGHGTDKAIIGGLLGMAPDDVRVPDSFRYAQEKGLLFSFAFGDIPLSHPNTARLVLKGVGGAQADIEAASLGGGRIEIRRIGDMALRFSAEQPTLIIRNADKPGTVAEVSRILSEEKINIATFHVNRNSRGGEAVMVIECDTPLTDALLGRIRALPGILRAVYINQD